MVKKEILRLIKDISGMSLEASPEIEVLAVKKRSSSVDKRNIKKTRNELGKRSSSVPPGPVDGSPFTRKPGSSIKPVDESYHHPNNKDKFCIPLTLKTARELETEMEKLKAELKALRAAR